MNFFLYCSKFQVKIQTRTCNWLFIFTGTLSDALLWFLKTLKVYEGLAIFLSLAHHVHGSLWIPPHTHTEEKWPCVIFSYFFREGRPRLVNKIQRYICEIMGKCYQQNLVFLFSYGTYFKLFFKKTYF